MKPPLRPPTAAALLIFVALLVAGALSSHPTVRAPVTQSTRSIGKVDTPLGDTVSGSSVYIAGWALDRSGIQGVEVRLDGKPYAARYGVRRADVAQAVPGYPDSSAAGFEFTGDFSPLEPVRHELSIVAVDSAGGETVLAKKDLIPADARGEWLTLAEKRHTESAAPFYILPGLSGVGFGGAEGLEQAYASYLSPTFKIGMRVPILYLRTTRGETQDWVFDPDWDVQRHCGARRIADDSLSTVIAYAVQHEMPVLFTLNGGIWADSVCDVPAWDVNDHLEQDLKNCQWNEHDKVMPDDYLKQLPGALNSPELGRSLTFNIYAAANRRYKKRNLQAAARVIAEFARNYPSLFVGVNLDPDTYFNPFFAESQWYDYNPGTLKQFRQWLQGSGPYAGKPEAGTPNLSRYRRQRPLTLSEVSALAATPFANWSAVTPPRAFPRGTHPFWEDAWTHEWEVFRRHLVKLHYDELSQWVAETGIPPEHIFSSQGFVAPLPPAEPFAIGLDSPTKNYDSGGMSVEGAIPTKGHLGAILYGAGAFNDVRMEHGADMFATFQRMDPGWGVVEFNTADLRVPANHPSYQAGYRALRDMFNHGARFASPMAWNGSNGADTALPGYVSFMAWRNTPLEAAMRDFALSHASLPLGALLWTFGTARLADADGWTASGATLRAGNGYIELEPAADEFVLTSPASLVLKRNQTDLLVLALPQEIRSGLVSVEAFSAEGSWVTLATGNIASREREARPAGMALSLAWPATLTATEQIRLRFHTGGDRRPFRVRTIAFYPRARDSSPPASIAIDVAAHKRAPPAALASAR